MEEMLINERFKSPNKEFEKVFNLFRKKDYFDEKTQVKKKQEEFVRFLKKGDPMATKVFKQNKEDMKSSLSFIEDMVMDYNKKNHFEAFQIFSKAVNDIEMKDSKSAEKSGNFIKSKIHNNSQKYSLGVYSAIRKQKFNNYKDVHKDVDELISKNEGFSSDAQRKAAFANGYEEKDKKNEGKKRFKRQDGIGKAKYTISFHDGRKKHKDGSDFFDIKIFKNKKDLSNFVGTLVKKGYKLTNESINEILVIVDKFDKRKQDYDKVYYQDGGKRPGDGDINKAKKEFAKLSKKHKDLTLISVGRNSKMYDVMDESVNEGISVSDERHFGKKGIIIMIDDNGKKVAAIFKDKKNADKFNRNKPSDIKKLLQLAKKTKYPKAIDESLNEAGKLAMGIAALTGTRGSAVQDFIDKNRINDKKLFKALKKANLQGRINFASALAGRPGNPNEKLTIKLFGESKKEVIAFRKKAKSETAFYDILDKVERKYGRGVFEKWLDKSLKDLKLNPKKYKTSADKQEALYQAKL
jgi:hypothetical protein